MKQPSHTLKAARLCTTLQQLYWLALCSSGPVSAAPFIYSASAQRLCSGESCWNKTSSIPDETPTFPPITPKHRSRSLSAISHCSTLGVCNEEWDCVRAHVCIYVLLLICVYVCVWEKEVGVCESVVEGGKLLRCVCVGRGALPQMSSCTENMKICNKGFSLSVKPPWWNKWELLFSLSSSRQMLEKSSSDLKFLNSFCRIK